MKKPYIICHMMESIDGRIDCGMTEKLNGAINPAEAVRILAEEFGVSRMAVVGGGTINAGFLDAGLLDEISMLIAPGIDGRGGMGASFDHLSMEREPVLLKLEQAVPYEDGAVWLRYSIQE